MKSISVVVISGRLTRDSELKYGNSGTAILHFSVAVNDWYKGEEKTSFFDCVLFGQYAEKIAPKLRKGTGVVISGKLEQDRWQDQSGQNRSKVQIIAREVQIYDNRDGNTIENPPF